MTEAFGIAATVLAVAGVLTNNRKMIVCFYLWMISNAVSLGLHAAAGIWSLAVRDGIFFVLCIEGILRWRRSAVVVDCKTRWRSVSEVRHEYVEVETPQEVEDRIQFECTYPACGDCEKCDEN